MKTEKEKLGFEEIKVGNAYYFKIDDRKEGTISYVYMYADKKSDLNNSISGWAYKSVVSTRTTCFPLQGIVYLSFVFDSNKIIEAEAVKYPMELHNVICLHITQVADNMKEELDSMGKTIKSMDKNAKDQFMLGYKAAMDKPLWKRILNK